VIARYESGSGRAAKSADEESGDWIASRISFTVVPPATSVLGEDAAEGYVGCCWAVCLMPSVRRRVVLSAALCGAEGCL
jgi:hypothetical protein